MITIETLSIVFTGLSISLAAFYYISTLRNTKKNQELQLETRQSQLFMQLFQQNIEKERYIDNWKLTEMEWDDYDDFTRKYDSSVNLENFAMRYRNWNFWEGMGLLLKKGLVDKEMIYYLLGGGFGVLFTWDKFGSVIKEMRVQLDLPEYFMWFEYLAEEMRKVSEEKGKPWKPVPNKGILIRENT